MTHHIPQDLLSRFVDGAVDEQLAVTVAEHLDACPSCASRAAHAEPLAAAFASARDPDPPPSLVPRILERIDQPDWLTGWEVLIGTGLLLCAAVLAVLLDSPLSLTSEALVVMSATTTMVRGIATAVVPFQLAVSFTAAAALTGAVLTLHFGTSDASMRRVL